MDFFCCFCLVILQKRKRKCVFNQGELDALEYHSKVSWKKRIFCKYMIPDFGHVQSGGHGCKQVLFLQLVPLVQRRKGKGRSISPVLR